MTERQTAEVGTGGDAAAFYRGRPWLPHYADGVPETVEAPERPVTAYFDEAVRRWSRRTAIVFYGRRLSYGQLGEQVERFAAALYRRGVRRGAPVALYLLNSPQYVIAYFAILKLGAVVTPISPVYAAKEVRHQLSDSGARTIVCQDVLHENVRAAGVDLERVIVADVEAYVPLLRRLLGKGALRGFYRRRGGRDSRKGGGERFADLLREAPAATHRVQVRPDDLAALPYTGGTTGPPKGAMLTHRNLGFVIELARSYWPQLREGGETALAFLPFYHIYGQVVIMCTGLSQGSTLVLFTTPDYDDILYAVERYGVSIFYGVPTLYEFLREYGKTDRVDWRRLKLAVCGADTLHETTLRGWERKTGARVYEGYGMTETTSLSHANPLGRRKVGSFGVPLPGVLAAVMDPEGDAFLPPGQVGELVISGPNVMAGYWRRPEENRRVLVEAAGRTWLRTGDLVRADEEGYFFFYDRKRDLIKYKGYSVFAREIEDLLYEHPQVKEAGVVGVPDPAVGQRIKANVVLYGEARGRVSEDDIAAYCRERLAPYKVPRVIEFRGELPKTDVGKVSRRELREELEDL